MIAFLGTGLLGSGFVRALINNGNSVQVWNRTSTKAKALEIYGAIAFDNINDAVNGAEIIHIASKDDASVNEILDKVTKYIKPGTIFIDHTTTTVAGCIDRTEQLKSLGFKYLHAPVFMAPQNALEGTGNMLVSGDQTLINHLEKYLDKMTGKVINLGSQVGKGAGIKLVGNLFIVTLTAGIVDMLSLGQALAIEPKEIIDLFDIWNPGNSVPARSKKMISGNYNEPTWELNMARKDVSLMLEAAISGDKKLNIIPAIAEQMDKYISEGYGNDDWMVIAKDAIK